jgi:uncharacterized protein
MAFIDRISGDLTSAMRDRDQLKLGALRMAKAALMNREVERGRALDDGESLQVIASLIKQRRDSFEQFDKAGRKDLADKEQAEIAVLEAYLPPPMDAAQLERLVDEAIGETGCRVRKGHGARDEGGDGKNSRRAGGRKGGQRAGQTEARGLTETPNLCGGTYV